MHRLSLPLGRLRPHYDTVIVGSGYGGAVVASRVARKEPRPVEGPSVCVLERGREWPSGSFPDRLPDAVRESQVRTARGRWGAATALYDFRFNGDVTVVVGCGLGGTSLINAGVVLPPTQAVLDSDRWPAALRGGAMDPYYRRASAMLEPSNYPARWEESAAGPPGGQSGERQPLAWPPLGKYRRLEDLAREISPLAPGMPPRSLAAKPAPIAVSFRTGVNHTGVQQKACNLCGNCVAGCNYAAKNTLVANYLADAWNHGAEIFCGIDVGWLERRRALDGPRWVVHFELLESGRRRFRPPEMFITADRVVLGAGSLGSTEILLRSRERGLATSGRLGDGFTGNGDFIAFAYNLDERPSSTRRSRWRTRGAGPVPGAVFGVGSVHDVPPVAGAVGPTIACMIDAREQRRPGGVIIQEGVLPAPLAPLLRFTFPLAARTVGSAHDWTLREQVTRLLRELDSLIRGVSGASLRNTMTFLAMGHDEAAGRLVLSREGVRVRWPRAGSERLYQDLKRVLYRFADRFGGRLVKNPLWSRTFGRRTITVHPLGGCGMANGAEAGVVNEQGQVFRGARGADVHDGLYVADGAVIPRPLGANPLLTICAVAERIAEGIVEHDLAGTIGSSDPDACRSRPPDGRVMEPVPTGPGVLFSERLTGTFRWDGAKAGEPESGMTLTVTALAEDLDAFLADPEHRMELVGVAESPGLDGMGGRLVVTGGELALFAPVTSRVETLCMRYRMDLTAADGSRYRLTGQKDLSDQAGEADAWKDLTRMPVTIERRAPRGARGAAPATGRGSLTLRAPDALRALASLRVTGQLSRRLRARAYLRFLRFYAARLLEVYAWPLWGVDVPDPELVRRPPRLCQLPERTTHTVGTEDGAQLQLTRYGEEGRVRGSVILAPGFGMSTYGFILPTIPRNLTEYLCRKGYAVWLLDYRVSERTPSSRIQFTIDDIARYDFPAAVRFVTTQDGGRPPDFLGHCVASGALLMSLLGGYLSPAGATALPRERTSAPRIRSAIASQFFTHVLHPRSNRLKAWLHIAEVLRALHLWPSPSSNADTGSPAFAWVWDRLLHLYPSRERCRNPVCRRNLFFYGEVVKHDRINQDTHKAVYDLFDLGNITGMAHLQRMVRAGRVVDARGGDVYVGDPSRKGTRLSEADRRANLKLPITLLQGMENGIFHPIGGERTLAWLRANGGEQVTGELYRIVRVPHYGHLDLFVGRNAHLDVFPRIEEALLRAERPVATAGAAP